ncbi:MAG: universal stress protein [Acidimicrobiales bacterium]
MTTPIFPTGTPVVVPLESAGATAAVGPGAQLARLLEGRIVVLSAVEDPHEVAGRRAEIAASEAVASLGDDARIEVVADPFAENAIAARRDAVVCMATSANALHLDGYLGSMAEKVVRVTGRPTVLIGPSCVTADAFVVTRVVLTDDGSPTAAAARPVATELATLLEAAVETVTVATGGAEPTSADVTVLDGDDVPKAVLAHAGDDAVIVIATRGRRGIRRLLGGSTTARIVRDARRPVVVVDGRAPDRGDPS